ncbi:NFACT RNA binding domain-containing protein [bacterium]|nr:NFACT RNA binding domain-containing protein [bacterium]
MFTALNWREIETLVTHLRSTLEMDSGRHYRVDRIVVPTRPRFPARYLKGEWLIRLRARQDDRALLISVRPRSTYFALLEKNLEAAASATRSGFDLELNKHLKDAKLIDIEALPQERVVIFTFATAEGETLGLVHTLIPAAPEALLVKKKKGAAAWPIITRSRITAKEKEYRIPTQGKPPKTLEIRREAESLKAFSKLVETELDREAFEIRTLRIEKEIKSLQKHLKERVDQGKKAAEHARTEPDWQSFGDLLKANLGNQFKSYETGKPLDIPRDPKLNESQQVQEFYKKERRKKRRLEEALARGQAAQEKSHASEKLTQGLAKIDSGDWKALEALEKSLPHLGIAPGEEGKQKTKTSTWPGRSFVSKDGVTIFVGRTKDENLELTFKCARGNDLWMHVRGRPGAHTLIPTQSGKSVPLETLLDAAALTVFYSGGQNWGKTEVDYTFKKYVKRIKDSTEASYTHNKTLIVEPSPERIKRLIPQNS